MTAETLLAVLGLLLAMAAGPAVALIFMLKRKRSARAARRSPLTENLLRLPGETLREQIDRVNEQADAWLATLIFFPMLIVCLHLGQSYVFGRGQTWPRVSVAALLAIGVAVVASRKLLVLSAQLDRLRLGFDGEVAIGQELGKVTRRGAAVFHDVPAEGFNIDHVVVATQGVFAVETKGFSKPQGNGGTHDATVVYDGQRLVFPHFTSSAPLEQAARNARWLSEWLTRATGSKVAVASIVALPGWFVDLKGRGDVGVYSGKQLAGLLDDRRASRLTEQQVRQIEYQIDQRCRTVRPTYRQEP